MSNKPERHPPSNHRVTTFSCFIDHCKDQAYEHIPYLKGLTWNNYKTYHNGAYANPMIACIKHFEEVWAGEF